ncbi:MAG: DedA family protein [Myxococcales bacterium]|nr:DedA family protein [Myxococcales bacterium]
MWSYLTAFGSGFLAATLLPVASEVVVVGLAAQPGVAAAPLWLAASLGNTLGAVVNYGLGRFALHWRDRRWFPVGPGQLARAQAWFQRWGVWTLLLAWAPVVGDALTVIAGIMRVRPLPFLALVFVGKAARYAALLWAVS